MTFRFFPNDKGNPPGKLADAELHFQDGPFAGLKLIGFSIWERKGGGRNVTFPARQAYAEFEDSQRTDGEGFLQSQGATPVNVF